MTSLKKSLGKLTVVVITMAWGGGRPGTGGGGGGGRGVVFVSCPNAIFGLRTRPPSLNNGVATRCGAAMCLWL